VSDFQRGQIVGVHLAGASVTKMATLLGVSRAAVFQDCEIIYKLREDIIS